MDASPTPTPPAVPTRAGCGKPLLLAGCVLLGAGITSAAWWYHDNLSASPFHPVQLSQAETSALNQKVDTLKGAASPASDPAKTLVITEREINGYIHQQGVGEQIKVSIRNGSVAASALLPVDKDVPLLGGHTLRVKIVFNSRLDSKHHVALSLADLSVGGISLPNAWLGGIKGLNLLDENSNDDLLKDFAAGIKDFQVLDGEVRIVLND